MAAVDQEELHAIEDLKRTNEIITSSLANDLQLLQTRHKNLIIDFDQQRAHLVESLLDRETLRKDLESAQKNRPSTTLDLAEAEEGAEGKKAKLQSMTEVSREQLSPEEKSPTKKIGFAKFVKSMVSPRSRNKPAQPRFPVSSGRAKIEAAELTQERHAIGTLQRDRNPDTPSSHPTMPQPPPPVQRYR